MPSAPRARVSETWPGVVHSPRMRQLPAAPRATFNTSLSRELDGAGCDNGRIPSNTSPVAPSTERLVPSENRLDPIVNVCPPGSMPISEQPTTAGRPSARATTAAWLVAPPRAVTMPVEAIMPCRSNGLVVSRSRITFSPSAAIVSARSGSSTAIPCACPTDAAIPLTSSLPPARASATAAAAKRGRSTSRIWLGDTPLSASAGLATPSAMRSAAIRTDALGVLLALRT